jgi:hypothetical protein
VTGVQTCALPIFTAAAENSGAGRTNGYNTPQVNITVEGYQSAKTVGNFSTAHYKRKPGIYRNLTPTSTSGAGSNATFDVEVDNNGAVVSVAVTKKSLGGQMGGLGYAVNETITLADALIGAGGAPDFTFDVTAIGTWGALQIEIARDQKRGMQTHNGKIITNLNYLVEKTTLLLMY